MEPDYSKYTQEELLDVYKNIDRKMYPERFKALCSYIELEKPVEKKKRLLTNKKNQKVAGWHVLFLDSISSYMAVIQFIQVNITGLRMSTIPWKMIPKGLNFQLVYR